MSEKVVQFCCEQIEDCPPHKLSIPSNFKLPISHETDLLEMLETKWLFSELLWILLALDCSGGQKRKEIL